MYQYLILFLLKDTHVRISTPQKESPTLPTNYLPTKNGFMGYYLLTKRVSIRGGADTGPPFAKPRLATYLDRNATLFKG